MPNRNPPHVAYPRTWGNSFRREKGLKLIAVICLVLSAATSAWADEARIAFVVRLSDVPTLCAYDYDAVWQRTQEGEADPWQEPIGCENVLIGKSGSETPLSPPGGFGVTRGEIANPHFGCREALWFTDAGDAIHCVIHTSVRLAALAKPSQKTARQSLGCVNASDKEDGLFRRFFRQVVIVHVVP